MNWLTNDLNVNENVYVKCSLPSTYRQSNAIIGVTLLHYTYKYSGQPTELKCAWKHMCEI